MNKMVYNMVMKVIVAKGKQAAFTEALQREGIASIEDWASRVEGLFVERKAYVKEVRTRYKEYNSKNGAFVFVMEFDGTEGQLYNIFHTPGLVDALKMVDPYAAAGGMVLHPVSGSAEYYYICYGGDMPLEMKLPPLSEATPRPGASVPAAPARISSAPTSSAPTSSEPVPFTEPVPRMVPVVEAVGVAPVSPAPVKRLLVDSEDSVLAFDLTITYKVPHTNAGEFEDWVASQWVHFYDAVPLKPNEKKFYDVKFLGGAGVKLTASFHTNIDMFEEIFNDEVLDHLEEVARVCDDETIYVQAPYVEGTGGAVKYEPIFSHYITLGKTNGFSWCFGGCVGGNLLPYVPPVQGVLPPVQVAESQPVRESPQNKIQDKVQKRMDELGQMIHELEEEVRQMKQEMKSMEEEIVEKETRIRMFEFAQDELAEFVDEE